MILQVRKAHFYTEEMVLLPGSGVADRHSGGKLFGVTNDNTDNLSEILDISAYEGKCRFKDCKHVNEGLCAVLEAVNTGGIRPWRIKTILSSRRKPGIIRLLSTRKRKQEKSFSKIVN